MDIEYYTKYVVYQDDMEYDCFDKEEDAQYVILKYTHKIPNSVWSMRIRHCSEVKECNRDIMEYIKYLLNKEMDENPDSIMGR